jgi:glc operon protein GlcG
MAESSSLSNQFLPCQTLSLAMADEIASSIILTAQKYQHKMKPIAVCVLDHGGNIIVSKRMDYCPPGCMDLACAKANTCIRMGCSSRLYGEKYLHPKTPEVSSVATPDTYVRLLNQIMILNGTVAAFSGGVILRQRQQSEAAVAGTTSTASTTTTSAPLLTPSSMILGAVGVSGASSDEDEYCAITGIQSTAMGHWIEIEPSHHSCTSLFTNETLDI